MKFILTILVATSSLWYAYLNNWFSYNAEVVAVAKRTKGKAVRGSDIDRLISALNQADNPGDKSYTAKFIVLAMMTEAKFDGKLLTFRPTIQEQFPEDDFFGLVQSEFNQKCQVCSAKGHLSCKLCKGAGACANMKCKSGTITYSSITKEVSKKCPACHGRQSCARCTGSGKRACSVCNGTGVKPSRAKAVKVYQAEVKKILN
ncbi:MAG: hypothetical protein HRT88_12460 [Lentisphaeraceae bacterium]|nr:hypothetical protein [Lentisphaeraceae bacterium]